jgi:hypothetical protein
MVRTFGEIPGVEMGRGFPSRLLLSRAGVHAPTQAGISGSADEGADSIVLSGGYEDDEDDGDVIVYTGHGGNDPDSGKQVAHQELTRQNRALATSCERRLPVRVVRGAGHRSPHSPADGYRYDGLYYVDRYWQETGRSGYRIWRFRLVRDQNLVIARQAGVDGPRTMQRAPEVLDAIDVVEERSSGRARGQGFRTSVAARRAVEAYAMKRAVDYFTKLGWAEVRDVSLRQPYDLLCKRDREELRVEVKGTTSDGSTILLTAGEVIHARQQRAPLALFVVSGIVVVEHDGRADASGGTETIVMPWEVDAGALTPVGYSYVVPNGNTMT